MAPEVTRERLYIDTLERVLAGSSKVMIDVEEGNNLMFLPLDQLLNRSQLGNSGDQSQSDGNTSSSNITDTFTRNTSRSRSREVLQ